jgi:hypothetical protein
VAEHLFDEVVGLGLIGVDVRFQVEESFKADADHRTEATSLRTCLTFLSSGDD